jgi:hypothetical protein
MRRIDKKINLNKANLLAEQRYLTKKGFISENEIEEDWKSNVAAGLATVGSMGSMAAQNSQDANPNQNSKEISHQQQNKSDSDVANPWGNKKTNRLNLKLTNSFSSGASSVDPNDPQVKQMIEQVSAFASANPSAIIKVSVIGSESQVTNQNNLKVGVVARARGESVKDIISNALDGSVNLKLNVKTRVGDVKWNQNSDKDSQDYAKDQYVQVSVEALHTSCSVVNVKKSIGSTNTLTSDIAGTVNNTLKPGNIPDRMVLRNGSGNIVADTGFFADGTHTFGPNIKLVPQFVLGLSKLKQSGDQATQNLPKGSVVNVNSFEQLVSLMINTNKFNYKKVMSDNSTDMGRALNELSQMYANGGEVVVYQVVPNGTKTVSYELGDESGKLDVYSPIDKTDFQLTGNCN